MARTTNEELAIGQAAIKALLDIRIPALEQKIDAVHIRISREMELSNRVHVEQSEQIKGLQEDVHGNGKPGVIQDVREAINRLSGLIEDLSAMQIRQGTMEGKLEKLILHHTRLAGEREGQERAGSKIRANLKATAPYLALILSLATTAFTARGCSAAAAPLLTPTYEAVPISTQAVTRTPAPVGAAPAPTIPADFPPAETALPTPTRIALNPTAPGITPIPGIIEVTPLGGKSRGICDDIAERGGWYTPNINQIVRSCPSVQCPQVDTLQAGSEFKAFRCEEPVKGTVWVCLNSGCSWAVLWLRSDGVENGELKP